MLYFPLIMVYNNKYYALLSGGTFMRIAIFTEGYLPYISGVVTYVKILKDELERTGHEVLIVAACPKNKRPKEDIKGVMYCPSIPLKKVYGYGVTNPLNLVSYKRIADFKPELIHVHTEFSIGMLGMQAARWLNIPMVYTLHTMYEDYFGYITPKNMEKSFEKVLRPVAHTYLKAICNRASEITVPSDKVVRYLRACGITKHINLIPNTAATRDFLPESNSPDTVEAARADMELSKEDIALLYVGRLGFEKSIDVMIDLFVSACKDKPRYKFVILGDGPEADKLKKYAENTELADRIIFAGRVEYSRVSAYYNACDLFCTASTSETNSITIYEATAAGLYVFQRLDRFNVGQVTTGLTGDVFETAAEFCELIEKYSAYSDEQRATIRKNVTESSRVYNESVFCERILNVYNIAISRHESKKNKGVFDRFIKRK